MKSQMETRLECLRLAAMLGSAKVLPPPSVLPYAMDFYKWVDSDPNEQVDTAPLVARFGAKR
jgi:hypothetical protein